MLDGLQTNYVLFLISPSSDMCARCGWAYGRFHIDEPELFRTDLNEALEMAAQQLNEIYGVSDFRPMTQREITIHDIPEGAFHGTNTIH